MMSIDGGNEQHQLHPSPRRNVLIVYGSETGNAQEVAEELGRIAERLHFMTHVSECDAVKAVRFISTKYNLAFHLFPVLTSHILGITIIPHFYNLCRLDHRPGRLPCQCADILEDVAAEEASGDIFAGGRLHPLWAGR
jgi:hypothetical protein